MFVFFSDLNRQKFGICIIPGSAEKSFEFSSVRPSVRLWQSLLRIDPLFFSDFLLRDVGVQ